MPAKFTETPPSSFNPMSVPGLSEEARKAVKSAFDAMSAWRNEIVDYSEKYDEQVTEKMAAAAKALGWPQQIVDATRAQMQSITRMQIETMDNMMGVWEEQIKSPGRMAGSASAMLSKLRSSPNLGASGDWLGANASQMAALNPLQFWLPLMEQWQKTWSDAMSSAGKAARST
jgi:hypothetical protein